MGVGCCGCDGAIASAYCQGCELPGSIRVVGTLRGQATGLDTGNQPVDFTLARTDWTEGGPAFLIGTWDSVQGFLGVAGYTIYHGSQCGLTFIGDRVAWPPSLTQYTRQECLSIALVVGWEAGLTAAPGNSRRCLMNFVVMGGHREDYGIEFVQPTFVMPSQSDDAGKRMRLSLYSSFPAMPCVGSTPREFVYSPTSGYFSNQLKWISQWNGLSGQFRPQP